MRLSSYAKVNLGLKVVGRRDDGFHNIASLFHEVDLCDTLELTNDDGIRVECDDPTVPDGTENLVYRAAEALRSEAGQEAEFGCYIKIEKRIPSGGGLGGGSGNAAAALVGLSELWGLDFGIPKLRQIAETIGSDVPFAIEGGAAVVTGRGEVLDAVSSTGEVWLVLVSPGFQVSTPWAFQNLNIELTPEGPYIRFLNSVRASGEVDLLDLISRVENDFLSLVSARFPSVQRILSVLRGEGALAASMSGTGATLYGGFSQAERANAAVTRLQGEGYDVHLCKPVRRLGPSGLKTGCRVV